MSDNQFLFDNNYDLKINGVITDVLGGIGINVVTVDHDATVNLSDTSVTPGGYPNTNLTVNQQGQITTVVQRNFSNSFGNRFRNWNFCFRRKWTNGDG